MSYTVIIPKPVQKQLDNLPADIRQRIIENPHTGKSSGYLTKKNMDNFTGSHAEFYQDFIRNLKK